MGDFMIPITKSTRWAPANVINGVMGRKIKGHGAVGGISPYLKGLITPFINVKSHPVGFILSHPVWPKQQDCFVFFPLRPCVFRSFKTIARPTRPWQLVSVSGRG